MNAGLLARLAEHKRAHPDQHAREAASALGVPEAALMFARVGQDVTALAGDFAEMFHGLSALGPVKTITRNEHAVIEKWGPYEATDFSAHMGQVVGPIDLRIFLSNFRSAFALDEHQTDKQGAPCLRRSLQFFDRQGDAIHKVYLEPTSNAEAWQALIDRFKSESVEEKYDGADPPGTDRPDAEIDAPAFMTAWEAMQDTHEFFMLLRKFGVSRKQALRLAPAGRVRRAKPSTLTAVLEEASRTQLPIMVFVGNRGIIQIHTGAIRRVKVLGPWVNVLDPEFNLHLREEGIDSAFIVEKPTRDGVVTALELFDTTGEMVAQLFGKRKPGQVESQQWRAMLAGAL